MGPQLQSVERRWTGGQYSLARMTLGALLLCLAVLPLLGRLTGTDHDRDVVTLALLGVAALAALALALGLGDRWAAGLLLLFMGVSFADGPLGGLLASPMKGVLLLCHLCERPGPYLSVAARGRVDPGGDWSHRTWTGPFIGVATLATMAWWLAGAGGATPGHSWVSAATLIVSWIFAVPPQGMPAPVPGQGATHVFYDGHCGLCHGAVRWILAEDSGMRPLVLAPLQGSTFAALVDDETRAGLPDSLVVRRPDDQLLLKSDGVLAILRGLGGHWRCLGRAMGLVPRGLRDLAYDGLARVRLRLFGEPRELCPLLPPSLAARLAP